MKPIFLYNYNQSKQKSNSQKTIAVPLRLSPFCKHCQRLPQSNHNTFALYSNIYTIQRGTIKESLH